METFKIYLTSSSPRFPNNFGVLLAHPRFPTCAGIASVWNVDGLHPDQRYHSHDDNRMHVMIMITMIILVTAFSCNHSRDHHPDQSQDLSFTSRKKKSGSV